MVIGLFLAEAIHDPKERILKQRTINGACPHLYRSNPRSERADIETVVAIDDNGGGFTGSNPRSERADIETTLIHPW